VSAAQGLPAQQRGVRANEVIGDSHWLVTVLRALPALAVGLIITFMQNHSAQVGLIAFGSFAVASGAILLVGSLRTLRSGVVRGVLITQGAISVASGATALVLWGAGIAVLLLVVTVFAALTGALETYAGLRARGLLPARDWLTVGVYTAVAAIVFVLIPPDAILTTGLIGAYTAILGVFLTIAGLSQKWANDKPSDADAADEGKASE